MPAPAKRSIKILWPGFANKLEFCLKEHNPTSGLQSQARILKAFRNKVYMLTTATVLMTYFSSVYVIKPAIRQGKVPSSLGSLALIAANVTLFVYQWLALKLLKPTDYDNQSIQLFETCQRCHPIHETLTQKYEQEIHAWISDKTQKASQPDKEKREGERLLKELNNFLKDNKKDSLVFESFFLPENIFTHPDMQKRLKNLTISNCVNCPHLNSLVLCHKSFSMYF